MSEVQIVEAVKGPKKFIPPNVQQCQQAFVLIDADGSGKLDVQEMSRAFKLLELSYSKSEIEQILLLLDDNGDKQMDLEEFTHFVYICQNARDAPLNDILFLYADVNCDGSIDATELFKVFKFLGLKNTEWETTDFAIHISDLGEDGISYEMFIKFIEEVQSTEYFVQKQK
ncbi:EF_hand domain-containing protein [Hexamita inflata]|uniref:EF_hand domain-containing protein n=1 Tax=Hexamita inflata TaxID=28002 RepID=A0ABP1HKC9_9EUKA